jgi:hypothetical protein
MSGMNALDVLSAVSVVVVAYFAKAGQQSRQLKDSGFAKSQQRVGAGFYRERLAGFFDLSHVTIEVPAADLGAGMAGKGQ